MLAVFADFDGGSPRQSGRIKKIGKATYLILPYSEDGDPCYKFRIEVKVQNVSPNRQDVELIIDWEDTVYSQFRDVVFFKMPGHDWQHTPGLIQEGKTIVKLEIPPGITHITLNPSYNYSNYMRSVKRWPDQFPFHKELVYESPYGRSVYALGLSKTVVRNGRSIVIMGRVHPYETGGSYNVEGILTGLRSEAYNSFVTSLKYNIWILPMICPDGVSEGLCKRNSPLSSDLAREMDESDPYTLALMSFLCKVKPAIIIDFHNWMIKERDGIFYLNWWQMIRVIRLLRKHWPNLFFKKWVRGSRRAFFRKRPQGIKLYAEQVFGAKCVTMEFSWLGRTVQDMRTIGMASFWAILHTI